MVPTLLRSFMGRGIHSIQVRPLSIHAHHSGGNHLYLPVCRRHIHIHKQTGVQGSSRVCAYNKTVEKMFFSTEVCQTSYRSKDVSFFVLLRFFFKKETKYI
jgi:hypothetical protein